MKKVVLFVSVASVAILSAVSLSQDKDAATNFETAKQSPPLVRYELAKLNTTLSGYGESINKQTGGNYEEQLKVAGLLSGAIGEISTSPKDSTELSARHLRTYLMSRVNAKSAAQVSQLADEASVEFQALIAAQNAQIISQNSKIIELLEKSLKK